MALKAPGSETQDSVARDTRLSEVAAAKGGTDFSKLPKTTDTVAFRIPRGEKYRLQALFARHGLTLTDACKKAVYEYAKQLERDK